MSDRITPEAVETQIARLNGHRVNSIEKGLHASAGFALAAIETIRALSDRIEELEAALVASLQRENDTHARLVEVENVLREANDIAHNRYVRIDALSERVAQEVERAEAANLRFYRAGIEAGAAQLEPKNPRDDWTDFAKQHHADAIDIRALPDPTPEEQDAIRKGETA